MQAERGQPVGGPRVSGPGEKRGGGKVSEWGSWQSDRDIADRKNLAQRILSLFQQRKPQVTKEWQQKLPDFVRRLEEELYRNARSKEEYTEVSTLEHRLQAVARRMVARPAPQQQPGHGQSAMSGRTSGNMVVGQGMPSRQVGYQPGMGQGGQQHGQVPQHKRQHVSPTGRGGMPPQQMQDSVNGMPGPSHAVMSNGTVNPALANGNPLMSNGVPVIRSTSGGSSGNPSYMPSMSSMPLAAQQHGSGNMIPHQQMRQVPMGSAGPQGTMAEPNQGQHMQMPHQQIPQNMQNGRMGPGVSRNVSQQQVSARHGMGSQPMPLAPSNVQMHPGQGGSNPRGNGGPRPQNGQTPTDLQSQKQQQYHKQQRWLLFLRHASRCQAPEGQCTVTPHCDVARKLWNHVLSCRDPKCNYPRCVPSRELLSHHQRCKEPRCVVCAPVRQALQRQRAQQENPKHIQQVQQLDPLQHSQPGGARHLQGPGPMDPSHPSMTAQYKTEPDSVSPPAKRQRIDGTSGRAAPSQPKQPTKTQPGAPGPKTEPKTNAPKGQRPLQVVKKEPNPVQEPSSIVETFSYEAIKELLASLRKNTDPMRCGEVQNPENTCQLCRQEKLTFEPPPIYCNGCATRIKKNSVYFLSQGSEIGKAAIKYYWCSSCYSNSHGDCLEADGHQFAKSIMLKKRNDEEVEEAWVACDKCDRWSHQICALFNNVKERNDDGKNNSYLCPVCLLKEHESNKQVKGKGRNAPARLPMPQLPSAKDLPRTRLTDFLEGRLKRALEKERVERAAKEKKPVKDVRAAEELTLRMVSNVDKVFETKPNFKKLYPDFANEFKYRSKALVLFQKVENIDVCLYVVYTQEYEDKPGSPNHRSCYLSYLDSIKYFRPESCPAVSGEALRTFVYQEILVGYLEFLRNQGFQRMVIWACPPVTGDDYILYCHPEAQKTPKPAKLREWYIRMIAKAKKEGVVTGYSNFVDFYWVGGREQARASELPYLEGDYWSGAAEGMIDDVLQEEDSDGKSKGRGGKGKKAAAKKGISSTSKTRRGLAGANLPKAEQRDLQLMTKLGETIKPMKEDFILVHLAHWCNCCRRYIESGTFWGTAENSKQEAVLCSECYERESALEPTERYGYAQGLWCNGRAADPSLPNGSALVKKQVEKVYPRRPDPDKEIASDFFERRDSFLSLCSGNHYQFDTLRRAKHSSMMVLYHLHNPQIQAFTCTCNVCGVDIIPGQSPGYRCDTCPDFDICVNCYQRDGHPHPVTLQGSQKQSAKGDAKRRERALLQKQRTMKLLVHASSCRNPQCPSQNCNKVKQLFHHGVVCKIRATGGCQLCKRMWVFLQLHARQCRQDPCPVPRCRDLKMNLRRLQQQSEERRRIAVQNMYRQNRTGN
mmetsp:Transcript_5018/g.18226  ORF Transcript_5018/g.18226 Transcript_5018/m.18226 type:complete len:1377 (+) Transcript_5018:27-4157(+)